MAKQAQLADRGAPAMVLLVLQASDGEDTVSISLYCQLSYLLYFRQSLSSSPLNPQAGHSSSQGGKSKDTECRLTAALPH